MGVYAAPDSFMSYGGGVYDDPACNGDNIKINHAMTLTGYGTDPKHGDYWILRNSWATSWGEQVSTPLSPRLIPGRVCGIERAPLISSCVLVRLRVTCA